MRFVRGVAGMAVLLALSPMATVLHGQQVSAPQAAVPSVAPTSAPSGAASGAPGPQGGNTAISPPPATPTTAQRPVAIPRVPQVARPGASTARNATAPRTSAGGAGAGTASATPSTAVTPSASMDTMLTKLAPQMDLRVGGKGAGGLRLSGTVGIVVMMGLLTLLPTLVLLMTGFTRILIVLNFLRQALGTQNAPPAQMVAALSLILTGFVMAPTLNKVNETALQPWMDGKIEQGEMMKAAVIPFREFMLKHTRDHDLQVFIDMSPGVAPRNEDEIPLVTLVSAFATSELRTAFQIGFALFLPFIIIDIVVSSVLMSMGMFMLPPAMISLPFKLLLFVLVDGWTLVVQSLVTSFRV